MTRKLFLIAVFFTLAVVGESAAQAASCSVSASSVSFGTVGVLDAAADTTGDLSVTCTMGTSYSVGLDGGLANAQPTARLLANGGATITYGLYKDSARSEPWGDATNGGTQSGSGTGDAQVFTIYGRIPAQNSPAPGSYSDSIVVTVTY